MNITRRRLVQSALGSLLAAGLWPGALAAGATQTGKFHFIAVNDLHYLNEKCQPWFIGMVKAMKAQPGGIDFVLISGDLAEHGTREQHEAIKDILDTLGVPYHVVVGNHDYQAQTDRQAYEHLHPQRLNYSFEHQGWQLIGLDTSEGQKGQNVKAPPETFAWLDSELPKLDKKKPTIVFTHFPLSFGVPLILQNGKAVLERFLPYNLQAVYSGHYHGFSEVKSGQTALTTNKCCSFHRANHDKTPQKGFFACSAREGKVTRQFVQLN